MLAWGGKTSNFTEEAPEGQRTDLGLDTTSCEVLSFITYVLGDRNECSIALYLSCWVVVALIAGGLCSGLF